MLGLKPGCKLCSESSHYMQYLLLQLQETTAIKKEIFPQSDSAHHCPQ